MDRYEWRPFLERYSRDILADRVVRRELPDDVLASGWMGFPPATEGEIAALERRIGARLPASYRQFLATTNGWRATGYFIWEVWPTTRVDWFRTTNQQWIDAYLEPARGQPPLPLEQHLVYGDAQNACRFRVEFLQSALQISGEGDSAVYLLNPEVKTPSGEWEAWFFANWKAGATRYRSFWELMRGGHRSFLRLKEHEERRFHPEEGPESLVRKLPNLVAELREKARSWRKTQEHQRAGRGPRDLSYYAGIIEALRFAMRRVGETEAPGGPPEALRERLSALAGELEERWQERVRPAADRCRLDRESGLAEGYREAAGIVRWFLNEP